MPPEKDSRVKTVSEQLEYLKYMRKHVRGKITKKCNLMSVDSDESDNIDRLSGHIEVLESLLDEINQYDSEIRKLLFSSVNDTKDLDKELEACDHYHDLITDTRRSLKSRIKSICDINMIHAGPAVSVPTAPIPRLASQIKLP